MLVPGVGVPPPGLQSVTAKKKIYVGESRIQD